MTVKELKEKLENIPDDFEVTVSANRCVFFAIDAFPGKFLNYNDFRIDADGKGNVCQDCIRSRIK